MEIECSIPASESVVSADLRLARIVRILKNNADSFADRILANDLKRWTSLNF